MPIANCYLRSDVFSPDPDAIVAAWSEASGVADEHMTVNLIRTDAQGGAGYRVMAWLSLPSLWTDEQVDALQLGLASALALVTRVGTAEVQVLTTLVESGRVVDDGETTTW